MEDTVKILKSCIVARQGGVPQDELDDDYFKFTGTYIPYLRLGYNSLYEFLGNVKEIEKKRNHEDRLMYCVNEPKTAHIAEMVATQKNHFSGARPCKRKAVRDNRCRKVHKRYKYEEKQKIRQWNYQESFSDEENFHEALCSRNNEQINHWYEEEYNHRGVHIMERAQKLRVLHEPIVSGKQLIGDDFFLQLAIRNIGTRVWRNRPCSALNSGLCKSGQTIAGCTQTLGNVEVLANRLVIMLGAEDIYRGHSSTKMINDMEELLECLERRFVISPSAITLCTIPPLANLSVNSHRTELANLRRFNNWIRALSNGSFNDPWNSSSRYNLIDFQTKNTTARGTTDYEFFQMDARMVSGTSHPYVLWNLRGRRLAMNLLRSGEIENLFHSSDA